MKKNTLSLKRSSGTGVRIKTGIAAKPEDKPTYKKPSKKQVNDTPILLVETWIWMTTNRENASVRKDAERRLISMFGSIESAKVAVSNHKAKKELAKDIVTRSNKSKVTPGAPPSPLIKTWLEMVSNRDSEEIRSAGKARLISAFGSLEVAIAYIENLPD